MGGMWIGAILSICLRGCRGVTQWGLVEGVVMRRPILFGIHLGGCRPITEWGVVTRGSYSISSQRGRGIDKPY